MSYSVIGNILLVASILVTIGAQILIKHRYKKYSEVVNSKGLSGVEVAQEILRKNNIDDVYVVETRGYLSDHYDPGQKVVRLSSEVFHGKSISAASIAAHEVGHAIQHKEGNVFINIRKFIFPLVSISSKLGYVIILIGLFAGMLKLFYIGILMLFVILFFQLVTLPVEFDASRRALVNLEKYNLLSKDEKSGAFKVLGAAALTYVAGLATSLMEIVRLLLIVRND